LTSSLGPPSAAGESTTKWLPRALTIERPGSFYSVAVTLAVAVIGAAGAGGAAVGGTAVGGTFVGGTVVGCTAVAAWAGATGAGAGWQALSKSAISISDARTMYRKRIDILAPFTPDLLNTIASQTQYKTSVGGAAGRAHPWRVYCLFALSIDSPSSLRLSNTPIPDETLDSMVNRIL
jgi:hypothetical protein